ncbi:MAG: hypothetical protein H7Y38_08645 [Armatimonadetes bacterium]|nr:hypothetical protein [Armatimonadota bacterium]
MVPLSLALLCLFWHAVCFAQTAPATVPKKAELTVQVFLSSTCPISTDDMAGLIVSGTADDGWGDLTLLGSNIGHYFEVGEKGKPFRASRPK